MLGVAGHALWEHGAGYLRTEANTAQLSSACHPSVAGRSTRTVPGRVRSRQAAGTVRVPFDDNPNELPLAQAEPAAEPLPEPVGPITADRFARLRDLLARKDERSQTALMREVQALINAANSDPQTRKQLLDRFLQTAGTAEATVLASALTALDDEEVEAGLLRLAQTGAQPAQRIAALEALSQSPKQSAAVRAALTEMLAAGASSDEQVTTAVVAALARRGVSSQSEQGTVIAAIKPLIGSANSIIRQQSLQVLAEWGAGDESVRRMVIDATEDPDPGVRESALQLMGQHRFAFAEIRDAILTRLQDPREDPQVRWSAWQALENYPLDEQAYTAYTDFKRGAVAEANSATPPGEQL